MKKIITLLFLSIFFIIGLSAQIYQPVDNGSSVKFIIKNVGMDVDGKFSGLKGSIRVDPADLKNSFFTVSIDANTINTEIDVRDNNLREAEYLDAKKFSRISFVSTQITHNSKTGVFMVKGTITIKGINKDISFPFNILPKDDGILLTGQFRLNRNDFKIGLGSLVLSNNLTVVLSVFAKKS